MLHSHGVMGLTFGMTAKTQFPVGRLFGVQTKYCAAKNVLDPVVIPLTTSDTFGLRSHQLLQTR